jgi:FdrA protein
MIDPTLRRLRIVQEAKDRQVAAIMVDVVLGYGSSSDPGGALVRAIEGATRPRESRDGLVVMAHVCGTDSDPQSFRQQSEALSDAGAVLFGSNALLAASAAVMVGGDKASARLKEKWGELFG